MDRLSFLVLGLLLGGAAGGAVAWRVQVERGPVEEAFAGAKTEVSELRSERDRLTMKLDVAEARAERAERESARLREQVEDTPAAKAARARREAQMASQKAELLRLLAADAAAGGAAGTSAPARP